MISRIKYIFSFFIILSLFGFGENSFNNFPATKNIKETEWITKSNPNRKFSKCYHFHQRANTASANLNLHSWSRDFRILYDRKINVKFLSQSKISDNIITINLRGNKIYISRKSIEYHNIPERRTEFSVQLCPSCMSMSDIRNLEWNYILNRKWINQGISSLDISMELNAFQNGYFG